MIEYIMAGIIIILFILTIIKGLNLSITVNVEHKYPEFNADVINDIYDSEGNIKEQDKEMKDFNKALKDIHDFMVDSEE